MNFNGDGFGNFNSASRLSLNPKLSSNSFFSRGGLSSLGTGDNRDSSTAFYGDRDSGSAATNLRLGTRSYSTMDAPRESMGRVGSRGDRAIDYQPQRNGTTLSHRGSPQGYSSTNNGLNPSLGIHQPLISGRSGIESLQGTPGGGRIHILNGLNSDRSHGMDREKMKDQLAYSNSLAVYGNCGILPGFQDNSVPSTRKSPTLRNQSQLGVGTVSPNAFVNSVVPDRYKKSYNEKEGTSRLVSRTQEVIDSARLEIDKAGDTVRQTKSYTKPPGSWPSMGTPRGDALQEREGKVDKRQQQSYYRQALERQIEEKNLQKAEDKKKQNTHPLGPQYEDVEPPPQSKYEHLPSSTKSRKNDSTVMKKHLLMEKPSLSNTQLFPYQTQSKSRFPDTSFKQKQELALKNLQNSRSGPLQSPMTPEQYRPQHQPQPPFQHNRTNEPTSYDPRDYNNNNIEAPDQNQSYHSNCPKPTVPYRDLKYEDQSRLKQQQQSFSPRQPFYPGNNGPAGYGPHPPPVMQPPSQFLPPPLPPGFYPPYQHPQQQNRPGPPGYPPPMPGQSTMGPEIQNQNQQTNYPNGSFQTQQNGQMHRGAGGQGQSSSLQYGSQDHQFQQRPEGANGGGGGGINRYFTRNDEDEEYQMEVFRSRNSNKQNRFEEDEEEPKLTTKDVLGKQKIWQRSDELPDKSLLEQIHKDELKQQIEENKRMRMSKLAKEKAEDEKLERQIQNYYEEQRRRLQAEQVRMEMQPRDEDRQQFKRNAPPLPRPQMQQKQRIPLQREEQTFNVRRENPESALARKLGNRKSNPEEGDRSRRSKREVPPPREYVSLPQVTPRTYSPPIPTVQRRLVLEAENGTEDPTPKKSSHPISLSKSKMDFFNGLKSKLSKERDSIERGLRVKLEESNRPGSR